MRILYLEAETQRARTVHSQILGYKGVHWDMQHCTEPEEAIRILSNDAVDAVLLGIHGHESIDGPLGEFLKVARPRPILAMLDASRGNDIESWIHLGLQDCIDSQSTGDHIMRRLRLAIARNDRTQSEYASVQARQIFRLCAVGNSTDPASPHAYEDARLTFFREPGEILRVALLKDRGTPRLLEESQSVQMEVIVFREVEEYAEHLRRHPENVDYAIVEQDLFEREGQEAFRIAETRFPGPPMLLLATDRSDAGAESYVQSVFDDCLAVQHATTAAIARSIRISMARRNEAIRRLRDAIAQAPKTSDRRERPRSGADRRTAARYLITAPLLAIPVLPDGSPDRAGIRDAFSIDFAAGGIGFQISNHNGIPSRNWVVGVECRLDDGLGERFHFSNVLVRNVSYPQGGVRMGTQFQPAESDLLLPERLLPKLHSETGKFQHVLSDRALEQWIEIGVLRPKLLHRISSCPECGGVASSGQGCRECGSPDIRFHELIHHFACAHVADASDFEGERELSCPKCLTRGLVTGADFEVIRAQYACCDCGYQGSQLESVGTCLNCRVRFPTSLALEEEVYGYDVDRLDILALLNSTG